MGGYFEFCQYSSDGYHDCTLPAYATQAGKLIFVLLLKIHFVLTVFNLCGRIRILSNSEISNDDFYKENLAKIIVCEKYNEKDKSSGLRQVATFFPPNV
jgi:hypothetical protein